MVVVSSAGSGGGRVSVRFPASKVESGGNIVLVEDGAVKAIRARAVAHGIALALPVIMTG